MNNRMKKLKIIIILIFISYLGIRLVERVNLLSGIGITGEELKFDSKEWKHIDKVGGEREMMLEDLIENYLKK